MADASVRAAVAADAPAVAAAQAASWEQTFGATLPRDVIEQLSEDLRGGSAVEQWRLAASEPPSRRHRLLVAESRGTVVGFAALGPADDPDLDAEHDAELLAMGVLPDHAGMGHGSRLVNASVDHLRGDGFTTAYVWLTGSDPLRAFLESAGWADDGARRSLDLHGDGTVVVDQLRLQAGLTETA
jgi:GNAT superfamily N-acetyltransferase